MLERIIAYVIANVGMTFSATSLAKFLKNEQRTVASETILNYIRYCCEAYLFYPVKREDLQGKQILASNEKYYIADHGIRDNFPKYVVSLDVSVYNLTMDLISAARRNPGRFCYRCPSMMVFRVINLWKIKVCRINSTNLARKTQRGNLYGQGSHGVK